MKPPKTIFIHPEIPTKIKNPYDCHRFFLGSSGSGTH
jgi:hypothetical protein